MLLFAVYLAGLNVYLELYKKKKKTIHFLGIFTLLTLPYFYSAHIFVCMYIFMSIFSCLIVHVLHSNFFLKYLEFSLKETIYISDLTIMIMIYQSELDFDFQLKI